MTDEDDGTDDFLRGLVTELKRQTGKRYRFVIDGGCRVFVDRSRSETVIGHLVVFCLDGRCVLDFFRSGRDMERCFLDGPKSDPVAFVIRCLRDVESNT